MFQQKASNATPKGWQYEKEEDQESGYDSNLTSINLDYKTERPKRRQNKAGSHKNPYKNISSIVSIHSDKFKDNEIKKALSRENSSSNTVLQHNKGGS